MMKFFYAPCLLTSLTLLCSACADTSSDTDAELLRQRGLALTYDALADTDISRIRYTVTQVDCATGVPVTPPAVTTLIEDLADLFIPGQNGTFQDNPLDASSRHLFADHYFSLPQGCYDVLVEPLDEFGNPSQDCAPASASGVEVLESSTTELLLISQCVSDSNGGLDVVTAINHAPSIVDIAYDPSKFICEDTTTICVTATDADDDPMRIDWGAPAGATLLSETQTINIDNSTTFCATWEFGATGSYDFNVTVLDLGKKDGLEVTMEELLVIQGNPAPSRAELKLPVHVMDADSCIQTCSCPDGFDVTPAGDECIKITQELPVQNPDALTICRGANEPSSYSILGGQFPGGTVDNDSFFDGRLNDVGVWACAPNTNNYSNAPFNTWLGFSVCLDIEEPGDYMLGSAVDNRIRISINGASPLGLPISNSSFQYWFMNTISLSSGLNIIEIEGLNVDLAASIGAEVYGPFASGSLVDDASMQAADYANNILWSTRDIVGDTFTSGDRAAWTCDGEDFVLNTCDAMPTCTKIEREPCQ